MTEAAAPAARPTARYQRAPLYPAQEKALFGPERWSITAASTKAGKTSGAIVWLSEKAILGGAGQNFWWVAPVYPQAEIAFRRMCAAIPRDYRAINESKLTITLANRTVIWFKSGEKPDNLYGEDVYAAVVDEASRCFAAGTRVDTPSGPRAIETIKEGEDVNNACGVGVVQRTIRKRADRIAVVMVQGGRIVCSHDHRFLTQRGWVEASALTAADVLVRTAEALRILRDEVFADEESARSQVLQPQMFLRHPARATACEEVRAMRQGDDVARERYRPLLRSILRDEVADVSPGPTGGAVLSGGEGEGKKGSGGILGEGNRADASDEGCFGGTERDAQARGSREGVADAETTGEQTEGEGWKRRSASGSAAPIVRRARSRFWRGALNRAERRRKALWLQGGHRPSDQQNGNRGGWAQSRLTNPKGGGRQKRPAPIGARVESVAIHKSGSDVFAEVSGGKDSVELYDLSVSGHPSFSVNGFLVHNCREEAFHALRTTLSATRGQCRFIGNVKGRRNWFHRLGEKAKAGEPNMAFHKLTWRDAVAAGILDVAEVDDARRMLPAVVFQELYEAEPGDDQGNPFGIQAIAECVMPAISSDPPVAWGVDLGKRQDWVCAVGLDRQGRVCRFLRWQKSWRDTKADLLAAIDHAPALVDSTGVGDPILEDLQHAQAHIEGYVFTNKSKQALMEKLRDAIQHRKVGVIEGVLRSELEQFEYEYTRLNVLYSAPEGCHDDCVCALALAWFHREAMGVNAHFKSSRVSAGETPEGSLPAMAGRWPAGREIVL